MKLKATARARAPAVALPEEPGMTEALAGAHQELAADDALRAAQEVAREAERSREREVRRATTRSTRSIPARFSEGNIATGDIAAAMLKASRGMPTSVLEANALEAYASKRGSMT